MTTEHQEWDVLVARHGSLSTTREAVFRNVPPSERGAPFVIDYYIWLLRSSTQTVLVDTGFSLEEAQRRGRTVVRSPAEIYAAAGLTSDWGGDIVLTHGHYDHTGHLGLFPNACIHVARAELEHWDNPAAPDIELISTADHEILRRARAENRVAEYEEDAVLAEGINLILAPGHTPGQLMVQVQTPSGVVLLTSDAAHFDEEYENNRPFHAMTDLQAAGIAYERIRALKSQGAEIVTGHQAGLINHYPPAQPDLGGQIILVHPQHSRKES
jgi:glyoxylase-like metal-dependent hydrolase (beta-lactamase superfamily II)